MQICDLCQVRLTNEVNESIASNLLSKSSHSVKMGFN